MKSFDLYFDESGNFEEHTILEDCSIVRIEEPQKGASQLVGILAPSGVITVAKSEQILSSSLQEVGLLLGKEFHANVLLRDHGLKKYTIVLGAFLSKLATNKMQPVRLSNSARLGFGDKVATYTSMVAETVVRIFEELTRDYGGIQIGLNIIAARVRVNGHEMNAPPKFINEDEYKKRLIEQIAFAAVRRGVAHNRQNWSISGFRFDSGLKYRPLQMCDFLSHSSYRNFNNCYADQEKTLKILFGNYDFPLNRSDILKEIEQHIRNGSLAHAIQSIAENWDRPELDPDVRQRIKEHCSAIVSELVGMPSDVRNIHLRQLSDWGNQFLAVRDLDMSDRIVKWLDIVIAKPLCDKNCEDVIWLKAKLLILSLSQYNHRGDLSNARTISNKLEELFPQLAGQWEYAPLFTKAMILRAVHLNDCCEYAESSRLMGAVAGFYGGLSELMKEALPGSFTERVRSKHRGEALGTQLQSEMFAGLSDPARLENARRLNEKAIDEFSLENDKQRQYQYRCQLETFAGNIAIARSWLAKSLGVKTETHQCLAEAIQTLDGPVQGFALLHWTRIGMEAGRFGLNEELQQFLDAFLSNQLESSLWVTQRKQEYPAHGIRRHLAVLQAIVGKYEQSIDMVDRLTCLDASGQIALTLIQLVGTLEVAARLPNSQSGTIRTLIVRAKQNKKSLLKQYAEFTKLSELVNILYDRATQYESSDYAYKDAQALLIVCNKVGQ